MSMGSKRFLIMISFMFFALFTVLVSCSANFQAKKTRHSSVLVLGAGMAGISAAKTLHENGVDDFTILEGYSRIGGRMRQTEFAGTVVELGANWVQGLKNNPIWPMVQKCNLKGGLTMASPTKGLYIIRNETGYDVTDTDRHKHFSDIRRKLDDIIDKRRKTGLNDLDSRTGIRLAGWQPENPAQSSIEYFTYDNEYGMPPHYLSCRVKMKDGASIDSDSGKQYFITDARGYSYIVEEMAKTFLSPTDHRLQLNKVVNTILWDSNGVSVSTTTGDIFTADYLLITFSIGVLKSTAVTFTPELPPQILEPIFKQAMVNYIKIFLKFPKRFWDKKQYIFYASHRRGYYPVWQDISSLGSFPDDVNILVVTVTGEEATRIQYQSYEETKYEIMQVLYKVYGDKIPEATDILYKRWAHDPLFYGCFSNLPIGMNHNDYINLASNVSRLYFAGEATSEEYNGYVHGAYFSGLERAQKILHDMKQNQLIKNHYFKNFL